MQNSETSHTEPSTALAIKPTSPLIGLATKYNIEPDKLLAVLQGTVIKPDKNGKKATIEEVAAFCIVAEQYNLNPWTKEIYAFSSAEKGVTPIVPIDGWVKIVNRHKDGAGNLDFNGCTFEEAEDNDGKPISCTCTMHVKGREHPIVATERYSECKRGTGPWGQYPFRMLRHKSYIQSARYAFGLSGIHDEDEARDITSGITVSQPLVQASKPLLPEAKKPVGRPRKEQPVMETATELPATPPEDNLEGVTAPATPAIPPVDRQNVLDSVLILMDGATATAIAKAFKAVGKNYETDNVVEFEADTLVTLRQLLKAAK
jgi:phage recombination protein Bet